MRMSPPASAISPAVALITWWKPPATRRCTRLAIDVLNPHGTVALLLTGESGAGSLPEGRKTLGIIQGDAVPQRFIPKLIALYQAGQFPFDRLVKFYDFSEINQAIADARRGDTIKPVLRISTV